jgi:hypothetical protein
MAEPLSTPVSGVVHLKDMSRGHISARDKRGVADVSVDQSHVAQVAGKAGRATLLDHRTGGANTGAPVIIHRTDCNDPTIVRTTEVLRFDGTAASMRAVKAGESISMPLEPKVAEAAPPVVHTTPVLVQAGHQPTVAVPIPQVAYVAPQPVHAPEPVVVKRQLKQVKITTQGFGTLRVWCQDVVVGPKVVALIYPLTGESSIVEPPSTAGTDNVITVGVDGKEYKCVSFELSYEHNNTLVVVLPRTDGE